MKKILTPVSICHPYISEHLLLLTLIELRIMQKPTEENSCILPGIFEHVPLQELTRAVANFVPDTAFFEGCFHDANDDRDITTYYSGYTSWKACKVKCMSVGYQYMALQGSNECRCALVGGYYFL